MQGSKGLGFGVIYIYIFVGVRVQGFGGSGFVGVTVYALRRDVHVTRIGMYLGPNSLPQSPL